MSKKIITITGSLMATIAMLSWSPTQDKKLQESKERGKALYEELCVTCHLADGKGTPGAFPPLAKSDYFARSVAKAIYPQKYGLATPITVNGKKYNVPMPALSGVSDEEIADITTFVTNSWGNKGKLVTAADVAKVKK